jgi:hypothetical protein
MVENREESSPKPKRRHESEEEKWVRSFLAYSSTDNITRFCEDNLNGVSLIRAVEALLVGECIQSDKCDEPGSICTFRHQSEEDTVEVRVFFEANVMVLEILEASTVREEKDESDAA